MDMSQVIENNCVSVKYEVYSEFRCPYDLKKVHNWRVKWNTLYVVVKEGDEEEEFEPYSNAAESFDWKRPDEVEVCDDEDIGYDPNCCFICKSEVALKFDKDQEEVIEKVGINHPLYKDKTDYSEYTRSECEYHAIDYDELHKDDEPNEEEEEDTHICGITGREFDATLKEGEFLGCKEVLQADDTQMLGNTSFCDSCYEKHEEKYYEN